MKSKIVQSRKPGAIYKIVESLEPHLADVTKLRHHPKNPRNGDIDAIAGSLDYHGQYKAIICNIGTYSERYEPNTIGAGNHTYDAATELGWTHIAVSWIDVDDDELDRILIIDNRTSDLSWNNTELIAEILSGMNSREGTGYDQLAFEELLESTDQRLEFTGERKKTVDERWQVYETTNLRQIHLIMDEAEYNWLMPRLGQLAVEYDLETNAEIVTRLIAEHFDEELPQEHADSSPALD